MSEPTADDARPLHRHRAFVSFWCSRLCGELAVQVQSATIAWQVYALARQTRTVEASAFLLGLIGLAQFLPLFALALAAGATADRHDRRRIAATCLSLELVFSGLLLALSLESAPRFAPIFAIAAGFGATRSFYGPANTALGPMLVPRRLLPRAIAWGSLAWQGAAIGGPALGGLLCAVSPSLGYGVAMALFTVSLGCMLAVRADTRPAPSTGSRLALIREGLRYVRGARIVLGAISLDLFAVLLGGATALLPVFARDVLHVGAEGYGLLRSGAACGAVVVAAWLARHPIERHAGRRMFLAVAVFGAATVAFASSRSLPLSFLALAVLGGADMVSVFVRQSLLQIVTPDAMRGRVAAVSSLFVGASNELGEFESGVAAGLLGPVGAVVLGGVGAIVVTLVWAGLFPELRDADRLE